ncbi:hypothetical protein OESDEN_12077 [Oesophagostomum dentatum]|uniref:Uncharacterized protein n=1 Tax=Oesophagostomum dentatum TaxID=61180 RepID=A0A0B1SXD2_OESDE|nr:hypothetical protein OESDEN_12077 [Oesophagostomum dentatum]
MRIAPYTLLKVSERILPKIPVRMSGTKILTKDTINPQVITMQYAVRGPIVIRAVELEKELAKGANKPFKSVIKANIGDAHAMGQKPITFIRQVLACVTNPSLMETGNFPADVVEHSKVEHP